MKVTIMIDGNPKEIEIEKLCLDNISIHLDNGLQI
jgi:hypothetical protein